MIRCVCRPPRPSSLTTPENITCVRFASLEIEISFDVRPDIVSDYVRINYI